MDLVSVVVVLWLWLYLDYMYKAGQKPFVVVHGDLVHISLKHTQMHN